MKKMGLPAKKDSRVYTYADYLTWPDEERWELIDGVAYDTSPALSRFHQAIVGEIFRRSANFLEGKTCRAYISPFDVRLPEFTGASDEAILNVVQPDVSVFLSEDRLDYKGAVGAPDIAIEVLSPYTSLKDQREKLKLYERFGVKEYWIIEPEYKTLQIYRLNQERQYGKPQVYGGEDTVESSILDGFHLDVHTIFQ
ncbi:MAG: Uma2 family endonuclease [Spirochaetota bacterium]